MRRRRAVRVQPGGSADRIEGRGADDAGRVFLKVRVRARPEDGAANAGRVFLKVRARPVDGAANAAVELAVAKALGVAKSAVRVVTGGKTRLKGLEIEGPPELAGVIEGWLADERNSD
jgi:hypothetical protein